MFALFEQNIGRLKDLLTEVVTGLPEDVGDCGCADWLEGLEVPHP